MIAENNYARSIQNTNSVPGKLIKHSAVIHVSGKLTSTHRRCYNLLLSNAWGAMKPGVVHEIEREKLVKDLRYGSNNYSHLYKSLAELVTLPVTFNILNKDKANTEVWDTYSSLLADVSLGRRSLIVRYSFPPQLVPLLKTPNMYARINIAIQHRFKHQYSQPLYEVIVDILGRREQCHYELRVADLINLLRLPKSYNSAKELNRRVIKPCFTEIEENTELHLEIEALKRTNRKIVAYVINISNDGSEGTSGGGETRKRLEKIFGDSHTMMTELLEKYSESLINANIDYAESAAQNGKPIRPGYYYKAITEDYAKASLPYTPTSSPNNVRKQPTEPVAELPDDIELDEIIREFLSDETIRRTAVLFKWPAMTQRQLKVLVKDPNSKREYRPIRAEVLAFIKKKMG